MYHPLTIKTINKTIAAQTTPRLSIYQQLEIDLWTARNKAANIPSPENDARVAELEEQELILIACLEGFIEPILSPRELAAQMAWRELS